MVHDGQGKVLMIRNHKWSTLWWFPGGKIERGESCEDALVREIREETGLEISDIRFAMVQESIFSPSFIRPEHFILLNYIAKAGSHNVTLNDEAEEFRWVTVGEAFGLELNSATIQLLNRVMEDKLLP